MSFTRSSPDPNLVHPKLTQTELNPNQNRTETQFNQPEHNSNRTEPEQNLSDPNSNRMTRLSGLVFFMLLLLLLWWWWWWWWWWWCYRSPSCRKTKNMHWREALTEIFLIWYEAQLVGMKAHSWSLFGPCLNLSRLCCVFLHVGLVYEEGTSICLINMPRPPHQLFHGCPSSISIFMLTKFVSPSLFISSIANERNKKINLSCYEFRYVKSVTSSI